MVFITTAQQFKVMIKSRKKLPIFLLNETMNTTAASCNALPMNTPK